MALTIASFGFFIRRGMVCLITAAASSILALVLIQAAWLPLALIVIALFAASQTAFRTTNGTLTQTLTPDDLRGRITSLQRLGQGFVVGSSLLVGWFAGVTSVRLALAAIGVVGLALAIAYVICAERLRNQE
jgi:MFS family permease